MYSRNLFVLDFAKRFFVNCVQISEAYAVRTLMKFGCNWRKIGRKGKCRKDSESTYLYNGGRCHGNKEYYFRASHEKGVVSGRVSTKGYGYTAGSVTLGKWCFPNKKILRNSPCLPACKQKNIATRLRDTT